MVGGEFDDLLRRAQAGDESAFAVLWVSLQPALLRFLRVEREANPEDLAADTWESVVKGLSRFRGNEVAWRAWVFTLARRRAIDDARRRARRPLRSAYEGPSHEPTSPDVADRVLEEEATSRAIALLRTLPAAQAEVIALRVIADLPVEAVAAIVGRSPGAVRVAAHRGLRTLQAALADDSVTH